ncbi:unnamed protein product [Didymodactylos carnosus]|uniref:Uncharacterized protein n=1 Tax=Didymodactylos carnosus TaxID=1234261 RepID=A0A8S2CR80_9BILA|nr:unnamed protein product [Didymodactylos carnosus]CAF3526113.1 unnamed protein product [Didymodactylos carnosus]
MLILILCAFLGDPAVVKATHFRGGTIVWKPTMETSANTTINITIIQTYTFRYSSAVCTAPNITAQTYFVGAGTLSCLAGSCATTGYTSLSITGQCIGYSIPLGVTVGQRSDVETLKIGSKFVIRWTYKLMGVVGNKQFILYASRATNFYSTLLSRRLRPVLGGERRTV